MIEGIGVDSAQSSYSNAQSSQQLDKNAFTQLLVTQLQNQDPMSPQSNEQLAAQLAQFSSLEQMELVNENLVGLARLQQGNALVDQITGASALVGQNVAYTDAATEEVITGPVEYAKIQDGQVFLGIGGEDIPLEQVAEVLGQVGSDDGIFPDEEVDGDNSETDETSA